jgi:hypothetical protein
MKPHCSDPLNLCQVCTRQLRDQQLRANHAQGLHGSAFRHDCVACLEAATRRSSQFHGVIGVDRLRATRED